MADFRGKVVYLYFFQSWCPGCHRHGFPTLQAMSKHFADVWCAHHNAHGRWFGKPGRTEF